MSFQISVYIVLTIYLLFANTVVFIFYVNKLFLKSVFIDIMELLHMQKFGKQKLIA